MTRTTPLRRGDLVYNADMTNQKKENGSLSFLRSMEKFSKDETKRYDKLMKNPRSSSKLRFSVEKTIMDLEKLGRDVDENIPPLHLKENDVLNQEYKLFKVANLHRIHDLRRLHTTMCGKQATIEEKRNLWLFVIAICVVISTILSALLTTCSYFDNRNPEATRVILVEDADSAK